MKIQGYTQCRCGCGQLELDHVAHATGGSTFDCWLAAQNLPPLRIAMGLSKIEIPKVKRAKRKNKGCQDTRRKVAHAQRRAMRSLKNLHPDEFEVLYDMERVRLGLTPVVRSKTYQAISAYHPVPSPGAEHEEPVSPVELQRQ